MSGEREACGSNETPAELSADRVCMAQERRARGARPVRRHPPATYLKHALTHPVHLIMLCGPVALVFAATWSYVAVWLLLAIGFELFVACILPRLPAFRTYVDLKLAEEEREKAGHARAVLLARMSLEHRQDLLRLELVVDKLRDTDVATESTAQLAVDGCLTLLATHVRLAIAYNAARACISQIDPSALLDEIRALELPPASASGPARILMKRRAGLIRRRAHQWQESREAMSIIGHQLAIIDHAIQLTYERCAAPLRPCDATPEVNDLVAELEDSQSVQQELATFRCADDSVDAHLLDLGRSRSRAA